VTLSRPPDNVNRCHFHDWTGLTPIENWQTRRYGDNSKGRANIGDQVDVVVGSVFVADNVFRNAEPSIV
jgi:hypothetical protein